jgi:hypothetical protein
MILSKQSGSAYASESGHWYDKNGNPAYTVKSAKGEDRPTTLRDARKLNLYPSVTTILKVAANEGLNRWIKSNLLMAAATLPKLEGESADEWIKRVEEDAKQQSQNAAALGTSIHASLEKAYEGKEYQEEHRVFVTATMEAVKDHFGSQAWSCERSFSHELGFGGKIDLSSPEVVIDFKTSAFDETKKDSEFGYDEHLMQLSAYSHGLYLSHARCANVYVSTTVPGLVKIKEWTQEEVEKGLDMFIHLMKYWQIKNKYAASPNDFGVTNET